MTDTEQIKIREMVNEIDERGEGLTDWEGRFIADLIDNDPGFFSQRQAEVIERIYEHRVP